MFNEDENVVVDGETTAQEEVIIEIAPQSVAPEVEGTPKVEEETVTPQGSDETVPAQPQEDAAIQTPQTVPIAALRDERNKRKDATAQIKEIESLTGMTITELARRAKEAQTRQLEEQGVDPELARMTVESKQRVATIEAENKRLKLEAEKATLKTNPYYANIDMVWEDVVDYANEHGMDIKSSYGVLFGARRFEEMTQAKIQAEAVVKAKEAAQARQVDATSGGAGSPPQPKQIRLTAAEAATAAAFGLTHKQYHEAKKSNKGY